MSGLATFGESLSSDRSIEQRVDEAFGRGLGCVGDCRSDGEDGQRSKRRRDVTSPFFRLNSRWYYLGTL